jgi:hypothetical protein
MYALFQNVVLNRLFFSVFYKIFRNGGEKLSICHPVVPERGAYRSVAGVNLPGDGLVQDFQALTGLSYHHLWSADAFLIVRIGCHPESIARVNSGRRVEFSPVGTIVGVCSEESSINKPK